jgi:hypothetical protein
MPEVNIFDVTKNRPESEWASFKVIGDKVQGVYVGNRQAIDSYQNAQTVYELLDKERNKIINVAIRNSKKPVIETMAKVFFGQIVGFVYTEDKKTKDGKSTFKSIDVRQDAKIVDHAWMAEYKEGLANAASAPTATISSASTVNDVDAAFEAFGEDSDEQPDVPFMSEDQYLKGIAEFARTKLGVTDVSLVKDRVMEATDLAFTKANYEEIFERLKTM